MTLVSQYSKKKKKSNLKTSAKFDMILFILFSFRYPMLASVSCGEVRLDSLASMSQVLGLQAYTTHPLWMVLGVEPWP